MELEQNFFTLFDMPRQFSVDLRQLKKHSRELLRTCHPDLFANASPQEQRLAVQYSAHVNYAYEVLLQPIKRAQHLMALQGAKLDDQHTVRDSEFLMQQMALREELEDARAANDDASLARLKESVQTDFQQSQQLFVDANSSEQQIAAIAKMQFFDKLVRELAL